MEGLQDNSPLPFLEEARRVAGACWCDDSTKQLAMIPELAEIFAQRLAAWMTTAAQESRNTAFYRGLLDECAKHLGEEVFRCDDGSVSADPLRLKIPELVGELAKRVG